MAFTDDLPTLKKVVSVAAPLLGNALTGNFAGVAISLISSLFGTDPNDISGLTTKIQNDPDAAFKLKKLELDHVEALKKIDSDNYVASVDDRKDARDKGILYKDFMRHLTYLVSFGFFGALLMIFLPLQIDPHERDIFSLIVGMLVSKWQTIIDYYFGSSNPK